MPSYLTDKCAEIRRWLAIGEDVYPDDVVTSWIRMAEEQLSTDLRVKHMIQIDTTTIAVDRVPLPLDWQEIRLARLLPGGDVLRYQTPDIFYNPEFPDAPGPQPAGYPTSVAYPTRYKRYTILGNYLVVGGVDPVAGLQVEMTYYQSIPPLTDANNNWINAYHPTIYMLAILQVASMYVIEDERGPMWTQQVNNIMTAMNARHQVDKASGSVLVPARRKTFG